MDADGKGKKLRSKSLIIKTWERCRSMKNGNGNSTGGSSMINRFTKSKSWPRKPEGCFSVHVGVEKKKYVVRTKCLNHPLFRLLLDEAEMEYGYANYDGPLELPCDVEQFENVLCEMEQDEDYQISTLALRSSCNFGGVGYNAYKLLSPARPVMDVRRPVV